ncbi:copper ion binding protein [Micromonospora sp. ATCC 39149]|uniref:Heavy-metal-associated domain-containing protein n=1 Tax=Micromonospora carbonacea TaxID=47853 RepID=A0A7D6C6M4_9ACTN|nr:heavy-metal-associated domain-containing protein [Micromonospora sp. ATCC 39149]EEP73027.1 copper ion binding protein [Micromonospora sp. ATCC 39149]QLJ99086.1 heavy-metal-associated domain-containing protein [Micromonospora carbonacea]
MVSTTYEVQGMSCGHCANSVVTEVGAIGGVTDVRVDLAAGRVTVTSDGPLDTDTVRAAVDEAGYTLVDA